MLTRHICGQHKVKNLTCLCVVMSVGVYLKKKREQKNICIQDNPETQSTLIKPPTVRKKYIGDTKKRNQNFTVVVPDSFATAATTTRRCKLSPIRWTALSWPVPQDTPGPGKHSVASFRSMSHRLNEGRTRASAFVSTSEVYTCGKTPLLVDKSILDTFRSVHGYKPRRLISRIKCAR